MKIYQNIEDIKEQAVDNGLNYIYVIRNYPQGNIKIGRTHNPVQRFTSLSGSNNGGNKISFIALSTPTYLWKIEETAHIHFKQYRIPNTEWFKGDELDCFDVISFIDEIFKSKSYDTLNNIRKEHPYKHI